MPRSYESYDEVECRNGDQYDGYDRIGGDRGEARCTGAAPHAGGAANGTAARVSAERADAECVRAAGWDSLLGMRARFLA